MESLIEKQVKELAGAIAEYMDADVCECRPDGFHVADKDGWFDAEAEVDETGIWFSGKIYYYDSEHEIGNTHPFEHYPDLCKDCRYYVDVEGKKECIYKGPAKCVVLDDLFERLNSVENARWIRLGTIEVAPAYKEVDCSVGKGGKHYYPGAVIKFRNLMSQEVLALAVLARAICEGIKKRVIGV